MHLPTLDIRVKQKGNHGMKWEINFEIVLKSEEKKNAAKKALYCSRQIMLF